MLLHGLQRDAQLGRALVRGHALDAVQEGEQLLAAQGVLQLPALGAQRVAVLVDPAARSRGEATEQ